MTQIKRVSEKNAAEYLGIPRRSLAKLHREGRAPQAYLIGRTRYYDIALLDEWLAGRVVLSREDAIRKGLVPPKISTPAQKTSR